MTDIAPTSTTSGRRHVSYDALEARQKYGREAFRLRHDLVDDPRFSLEALAELAERLPRERIEHKVGNRDVVVPDSDAIPQPARSPAESIRRIEEQPAFVTLPTTVPGVPRQAGYQELFEELLEELAPMVPGGRDALSDHHAVIIVASGGNTTPSHVDPEPSFLLHVRGVKRFSIGRHANPGAEQRELEAFYGHEGHNTPSVPVDVEHFDLAPGEALHVPPVTPHWVQNGPEVTISFSVGFQTVEDHRRMGVFQLNGRLRKLGLSPAPYGAAARRDRLKGDAMYAAFRARNRLLRRP
jgi:mannose-6-phosphate isomerase-like protein (cupin superfamily)